MSNGLRYEIRRAVRRLVIRLLWAVVERYPRESESRIYRWVKSYHTGMIISPHSGKFFVRFP